MKVTNTFINDLYILEPQAFNDERGVFFESFNEKKFFEAIGQEIHFVQDNQSISAQGVLRGLHLQKPPYSQGKLVRVCYGSALDVAVDLRHGSKTFGHWFSIVLSDKNRKQLWIPKEFAHGFLTLEPNTIFSYKTSNYYQPDSEICVSYDDKELNIDWIEKTPSRNFPILISEKDQKGMSLTEYSNLSRDLK